MSQWTSVSATFHPTSRFDLDPADVLLGAPTGSEGGPTAGSLGDRFPGVVYVDGRLRDTGDFDAPAILAWWLDRCEVLPVQTAKLTIDVDSGPRYRFAYDSMAVVPVTRLRGVLD